MLCSGYQQPVKAVVCHYQGRDIFINELSVAVLVAAHHHKFGKPRWVQLNQCRWRGHIDDPFVASIVKARGERSLVER